MTHDSLFLGAVQLLHELIPFVDDCQQLFKQQLLALLLTLCLLPVCSENEALKLESSRVM